MDTSTPDKDKRKSEDLRKGLPKNSAIFIFCMGIAFFLWLTTELSQVYTSNLIIDINYTNLPDGKLPVSSLVTKGNARVEASGFRLIFAGLKWTTIDLSIDYDRYYESTPYILSKDVITSNVGDLPNGYKLIALSPDTLPILFESSETKKVPVAFRGNVSPARQFKLMGDITLEPESVEVTGPLSVIDTLLYWPTNVVEIEGIKSSITDTISLDNDQTNMTVSPNQVIFTVPIEAYTEASVNVPIKSINLDSGNEVSFYPDSVTVTFLVGLSKHNTIDRSQFEVIADFKNVSLEEDNYITLQLSRLPPYIKNPTVSPLSVEYILYQ